MSSILIEVAAFTPSSALSAAQGGADRIELCSGYAEGGLSPSIGSVAFVREHLNIPIHVMVRPRVGHFSSGIRSMR
jgi:copper homeostasis protein